MQIDREASLLLDIFALQQTANFKLFDPLQPNISTSILHSVLNTFPMVLERRM